MGDRAPHYRMSSRFPDTTQDVFYFDASAALKDGTNIIDILNGGNIPCTITWLELQIQ